MSLLIDQAHHPRAIMEYLGHSDISVTMNRYGHLYQATMTTMATSLEKRARGGRHRPDQGRRGTRAADATG